MKKILGALFITTASLLIIAGCANKDDVKVWDTISIIYTATFSDGQIFDQNTEKTPLVFTVGSGEVIQWLDEGIIWATVGKTKSIIITPDKWYGKLYNTNNIQKISQLIFDKLSIKPENWTTQTLGNIQGIVKGIETDGSGNVLVLFDINPRQTRDTIEYTVTVLTKK
jgi:FKBP-type peptidyl-prolyl cis-trans isomerase 2